MVPIEFIAAVVSCVAAIGITIAIKLNHKESKRQELEQTQKYR